MDSAERHTIADQPAKLRSTVRRVRSSGRTTQVPVVAQSTLEGGVAFQANTGGRLVTLGGIEAERVHATLENHVPPEVAAKARRQRAAIGSHYDKDNPPKSG